MSKDSEKEIDFENEPLFSQRRIKIMIIGAVLAIVAGVALANLYTYTQYGGTMFDGYLSSDKKPSPVVGKFAHAKGTGDYVGVIKGEGTSPRRGEVYYIERPGGNLMEVSKDKIEVREPGKE